MGWAINVHKEAGDPVHIDVSGEMLLDKGWEDRVEWLAKMLSAIGVYDGLSIKEGKMKE